jgi:hypothetical protein
MNSHPLECICWHRTEPFQQFARQAISFMRLREDRSFEVSKCGLIVSGETEASLASAIETLKNIYGDDLCVGQFTIRHRHGIVLEEPHMGVRVLCPATNFNAVREDLVSRGAVISDAEVMPPIAVIRATASLAALLGYSQRVAALTDAQAREVIWLSHYAPLPKSAPDGSVARAQSAIFEEGIGRGIVISDKRRALPPDIEDIEDIEYGGLSIT